MLWAWGLGFRVEGLGFKAQALRFEAEGFGVRGIASHQIVHRFDLGP